MLGFLKKQRVNFFIAWFILVFSCNQGYKPKPKGYNQIQFPEKKFEQITVSNKYSFKKNTQANHKIDNERFWVTLKYEKLKAEILITHKEILKNKELDEFIQESYKLIGRHQIKAESIIEKRVVTPKKKHAVLFEINGEVASPYQFITTDSSKNFLRAALYLDNPVANDSIMPIVEYLKNDVNHILNTLVWNGR